MSTATARLLIAASEKVGGSKVLAERLGVTEEALAGFMSEGRPLPDPLLLRVVDVVLAEGLSPSPLVKQPPRLQEVPGNPENGWDEGGATAGAGAAE